MKDKQEKIVQGKNLEKKQVNVIIIKSLTAHKSCSDDKRNLQDLTWRSRSVIGTEDLHHRNLEEGVNRVKHWKMY